MAEKHAYSQAVNTGKYDKATGLLGKYDNVRRFWEDQMTAFFLRPALNNLVDRKKKRLERIRILDIGCGSGDGYDLLMGVTTKDPGIFDYITAAITPEMLQAYVGTDINPDLLKQAEVCYGDHAKMSFVCSDFSNGLPPEISHMKPFDIYFSSFGTLSHFTNDQCVKIFADICRHGESGSLVIGDWLGRYSYEWQDLWHHPADEEYFMDYRISYIYPEEERADAVVASFPLKLTTRDEIMEIVERAQKAAGARLEPLTFFDRSIFIGRHMDTGDYNAHCPKLREPVNSLFEGYLRTNPETLLVDYAPREGFDHLNNFFEMFFMSCNTLVNYTVALLSGSNGNSEKVVEPPGILPFYPQPLKEAMETMRRVIEGVSWIQWGDVRANVIEPHLGYSLRKLEMELQQGTGMGHGLVGIFEIH